MAGFCIVRLSPTADIPPFDCGNEDINDFLANDAVDYQDGLLAVTYLVMSEGNVLGYFCLLNDKLAYLPEDKGAWNKVNRKVRNHKRMKSYPAVKIGRLGTQKSSAHKGIGRDVIDFIKLLFIQSNKTGCRFLTVDAHKDAVGFYLKCGFSFFTDTDIEDDTRLMYYDLKPFKDMYEMSDCIEGQKL
jgi:GNAT superfamily N-acetyltransferase